MAVRAPEIRRRPDEPVDRFVAELTPVIEQAASRVATINAATLDARRRARGIQSRGRVHRHRRPATPTTSCSTCSSLSALAWNGGACRTLGDLRRSGLVAGQEALPRQAVDVVRHARRHRLRTTERARVALLRAGGGHRAHRGVARRPRRPQPSCGPSSEYRTMLLRTIERPVSPVPASRSPRHARLGGNRDPGATEPPRRSKSSWPSSTRWSGCGGEGRGSWSPTSSGSSACGAPANCPSCRESRHLVFTGNPGTGKTTVARLLAQIYRTLGVVDQGPPRRDRPLAARGRLRRPDRHQGRRGRSTRPTGRAADRRGVRAGPGRRRARLRPGGDRHHREAGGGPPRRRRGDRGRLPGGDGRRSSTSNPGLRSRFPKTIHFPDYSNDELMPIFEGLGDDGRVPLRPEARAAAAGVVRGQPRDTGFGNGRLARNLFEAAVARQAVRLVQRRADPTDEQLTHPDGGRHPPAVGLRHPPEEVIWNRLAEVAIGRALPVSMRRVLALVAAAVMIAGALLGARSHRRPQSTGSGRSYASCRARPSCERCARCSSTPARHACKR